MKFSHLVYVPCSMLTPLNLESRVATTILAAREDEALAIGAGLAVGGVKPLVAMQNSGLANALNTLGSLIVSYQIAIPLLVSMRGGTHEHNPAQIPIGNATSSLLDALGLPWTRTQPSQLDSALHQASLLASEGITTLVLLEASGPAC